MVRRSMLLLAGVLLSAGVPAQTLKVLTTGAVKQPVLAAVPAIESRAGIKVQVQNDTAGALLKRIQGGEAFDVVILTTGGLEALAKAGRIDRDTIQPVGKVGIGIGVKEGAPIPPMQTVDDFKAAVLNARKVAYIDPASGGSSGIYLDGLFQRMGIAEAVRAKAVLVPGGLAAERVARGEADLVLQQVTEITPVAGVKVVGLLPEPIQNYTSYGMAISSTTTAADAARAFVAELSAANNTR